MKFIRQKRLLALIGIITLILGIILPYLTFSFLGYSQSISLWKYWEGKVILVLTVANALFIFKDYIQKYIPKLFSTNLGTKIANVTNPKISLIPTILVVGFVIYLNTKFDFNGEYLKNGIGFYLLWLGIICLVAHAIIYKKPTEEQVNSNTQTQMQQPAQAQMQQPVQAQMQQPTQTQMQQPTQPQMQQPTQTQMQQPVQNGVVNKKFCPNCGNQLDETATQCFMCGSKF